MSDYHQQFKDALAELAKPEHSTGSVIKTGHFLITGNTDRSSAPYLLPLSIDDQGRLWIERNGSMLCVLDTRNLRIPPFIA